MVTTTSKTVGYVEDRDTLGIVYTDLIEYVPDLTWPLSIGTYAKMRRDPQIAGILKAHKLPIERARWAVDPAGCRPEVVKQVADDLGLAILGTDDEPGPARRRNFTWADHLPKALCYLDYGHYPFEMDLDIQDGADRLTGLWERTPATIAQFETDDSTGELVSMTQLGQVGNTNPPPISADRLVWYVHDREGAAWQGVSLLRPMFGPWLIKHEMWRVHGITHRRAGAPTPVMEALPGTAPTAGQMQEAQQLATQARAGDQAGASTPPGFSFHWKGLEGQIPDTLSFIRYLDQQMSRACLAGMLDLGDTPNGSRALGAEFVDLFLLSLQAKADYIAKAVTADLVVTLVDLNWGETEPAPRVVVEDVGADHSVTAEALQLLLSAGALSADPALEEYVRKAWRLPEKEEPPTPPPPPAFAIPPGVAPEVEPTGAVPPQGSPVQPQPDTQTAQAASAGRFRRLPNDVEQAAATDFARLQDQFDNATDLVVSRWGPITRAQRLEVLAAVEQAVESGDERQLRQMSLSSDTAAALLASVMIQVAEDARDQMTAEAVAQGAGLPSLPDVDPDRLTRIAGTLAGLLAAGLAGYAGYRALQAWRPGDQPMDVADTVDQHLTDLSDANLRTAIGQGITAAQNHGRGVVMQAASGPARYYASEIMDANTCPPCQRIDGHEFPTLDEALATYPTGGYEACQGGARCRGIVVARWEEAA